MNPPTEAKDKIQIAGCNAPLRQALGRVLRDLYFRNLDCHCSSSPPA